MEIKYDKEKMKGFFILYNVMFLIGMYFVLPVLNDPKVFPLSYFIFLVPFLPYPYYQKLFSDKPALIMSEEGLQVYMAGANIGLIPWSQIVDVRVKSKEKTIMLKVPNFAEVSAKMNFIWKVLKFTNIDYYKKEVRILTHFFDKPQDEIVEEIKKRILR